MNTEENKQEHHELRTDRTGQEQQLEQVLADSRKALDDILAATLPFATF